MKGVGEAGLSGSKLSVKMESEMLKDDKNKNPPKQQIQGPENKYFDLRKIEANNWPQLLPKNWALVLVTSNRNWSIWGQFGISVEICIFCKFFNLTIQNIHLGNIYRNCKLCDFRQHPWILLPRSYQKSLNTSKTHSSSRGVFEDRFGDIKHRITINYQIRPNSRRWRVCFGPA